MLLKYRGFDSGGDFAPEEAGNGFDTLISPVGLITGYPIVDRRTRNAVLSGKGFDWSALFPTTKHIFDLLWPIQVGKFGRLIEKGGWGAACCLRILVTE